MIKRISELNRAYTALHYVLLFPRGEDGWHPDIPLAGVLDSGNKRYSVRKSIYVVMTEFCEKSLILISRGSGRVSQMQFYAYQLQVRSPSRSLIHWGGRLFQQWVVDVYASMEQNRLRWVTFHQEKIRSDLYQGLQDAVQRSDSVAGNVFGMNVGKRIVLPRLLQEAQDICISSFKMRWLLSGIWESQIYF